MFEETFEWVEVEKTLRVLYKARVARWQKPGSKEPSWTEDDFVAEIRLRLLTMWRTDRKPDNVRQYAKMMGQHLLGRRASSGEERLRKASREWDEFLSETYQGDYPQDFASLFGEDRVLAVQQLACVNLVYEALPPAELEAFQRHLSWMLSCLKGDVHAEVPSYTELQKTYLRRARTRLKQILKEKFPLHGWWWDQDPWDN